MATSVDQHSLLIVDTAPAMAQVLKAYAWQNNYDTDVFSDPADAGNALCKKSSASDANYSCIVLGWPGAQASIVSEFLLVLAEPAHRDLPLVIITEEPEEEVRSLVRGRQNTLTFLWRDYKRLDSVIQRLIQTRQSTAATTVKEPVVQPLQYSSAPSNSLVNPSSLSASILLVDNTPLVCVKLRELLQGNGYTVIVAGNAAEARDAMAKSKFDLVLSDYHLSDQNGEDLCRYMQSLSKESRPVYAVITSENLEAVVQKSLSLGAITCLDKSESIETLFARLNAIATGLKTSQGPSVVTEVMLDNESGIVSLVQSCAVPSVLLDKQQNIVAANQFAADMLSNGDRDNLQHKNFESTIHGAPVRLSPQRAVKALFRSLEGRSFSVAYRSQNISGAEFGLADDLYLVTFKSETHTDLAAVQQSSESAMADLAGIDNPLLVQSESIDPAEPDEDSMIAELQDGIASFTGQHAPAEIETTGLVEEQQPQSPPLSQVPELPQLEETPRLQESIELALGSDNIDGVFCLLMLDIKMVAAVTGDRLSLGKCKPMLALVEAELARQCTSQGLVEYLEDGRFAVLYKSEKIEQSRLNAGRLVAQLPGLLADLSDVKLLSHASFIELPADKSVNASYVMKHCEVACMKTMLDKRDNKIFDITASGKMQPRKAMRRSKSSATAVAPDAVAAAQ